MKEETLLLTKEQKEIVMNKIASKKNGAHELMEMVLNSLMRGSVPKSVSIIYHLGSALNPK